MFDMGGMYLLLGGIFLIGALFLAAWVLRAYALWRMARWAGMSYPWLAWVPFVQYYIQGSLCDRSIFFRSGRKWHLAVVLPVLSLLAPSFLQIMLLESLSLYSSFFYNTSGLQQLFRLIFLAAVTAGLYYLYADYAAGQEVLYTILSFLFPPVAPAVLLTILRDRVPLSVRGYSCPPPPSPGPWTTGPDRGQGAPYAPPAGRDRLPLEEENPDDPRR